MQYKLTFDKQTQHDCGRSFKKADFVAAKGVL